MKYQEIIERTEAAEASESTEAAISVEKLREVVRLVENFEEVGEDGSYSERELSSITGLRDLLTAYESAVLGPVPAVSVRVRYYDAAPTWNDIHSGLMVMGANGVRCQVMTSSDPQDLILHTAGRDLDEVLIQVKRGLRQSWHEDGRTGTWAENVIHYQVDFLDPVAG